MKWIGCFVIGMLSSKYNVDWQLFAGAEIIYMSIMLKLEDR